jgi:hypothetical protein
MAIEKRLQAIFLEFRFRMRQHACWRGHPECRWQARSRAFPQWQLEDHQRQVETPISRCNGAVDFGASVTLDKERRRRIQGMPRVAMI